MIVLYIGVLGLLLWGCGLREHTSGSDALRPNQTNAIKGIFIALVFISHVNGYISSSGYDYGAPGDGLFSLIGFLLGQLIVVMFLFYSGYGVMESVKSRKGYVDAMPKRRILNTLLNFDVAVLVFILVDVAIGKEISLEQCFLSFVAWDSVGNSNWYIFVIILCYIITFLSFKLIPSRYNYLWVFILVAIASLLLSFVKEAWWYNTMWAYPFGILFSKHKEKVLRSLDNHYWIILVIFVLLFAAVFFMPWNQRGVRCNILSICFALLVVLCTMKLKLGNPVTNWLGMNLFPLYIYQRLPMMCFRNALGDEFVRTNIFAYIIICASTTALLVHGFRFVQIRLAR